MAFCMKCGTQLPNEANFCPICGTKNAAYNNAVVPQPQESLTGSDSEYAPTQTQPNKSVIVPKQKRKLSKGAIIAIIVGAIVATLVTTIFIVWAVLDAYYVRQFEESSSSYTSQYDEYDLDSYIDGTYDNTTDTGADDTDTDVYTDHILAMSEYAGDIVEDISEDKEYIDSGYYDSCAVLTDANADDIYELYAVYYKNKNGIPTAYCEVWSLEIGNEKLLLQDSLYSEVGGNSGSLSVCVNSGEIYVGVTKCAPQGERANNSFTYIPLNDLGKLSSNSHVFNENGGYTIDNESVSKTAFDNELEKYYTIFSIPDNSSDSAMVMTFEEFITIYG